MSGHRMLQVESTLKRAVATVLAHKLSDPRITGLISVTRISVSPDLHDAYVYVSVLPAEQERTTLYGLRHATRYIHSLVCKEVELKTVPHLEFRIDSSLKREADVFDAIRRAADREGLPTEVADANDPNNPNNDNPSPDQIPQKPIPRRRQRRNPNHDAEDQQQ